MASADTGRVETNGLPVDVDAVHAAFRYATVGRIADSVTHDLNNWLGAASAYAELVSIEENLSPESRRMTGEVIASLHRCARLMANLTNLARADRHQRTPVEAKNLVDDAMGLYGFRLKAARARVETVFDQPLPILTVDAPNAVLALLHLLINAYEALEGVAEKHVRLHVHADETHMHFAIWNNGPLLEAGEVERLSQPFVSTKGNGHLGLGLAVARATAEAHNGMLRYAPETGFTLSLASGRC